MWSIMALQFENENLFYTYKGLLEDKITIRSTGVWWYLSQKYMGKTTDMFDRWKFWLPQNPPF